MDEKPHGRNETFPIEIRKSFTSNCYKVFIA